MSWVFAYGSLIWRPGFDVAERRVGYIEGWRRRFWQGSTDHRGTPEAPGRVVTLESSQNARCWGLALRLPTADSARIMRELDVREQGGYELVPVTVRDPSGGSLAAVTYVAPAGNPNWLGPAAIDDIAAQVADAVGPSGANRHYVDALAAALAELDLSDDHVEAVATAVSASREA